MLTDFVVLGVGIGTDASGMVLVQEEQHVPPGIFICAQGVTLDHDVFRVTRVRDFVLDVTVPGK
ncbi:MAG TPA: hypothetical protein VFZ65_23600 [Planctomycetota bacterium]|nr:hypothetical protein [Planctomycetota bacterium]